MVIGKVETQVPSARLREHYLFRYTALCVSGFDFRETESYNYPTGTSMQHIHVKDEAFPLRTHEVNGRGIL